MNGLTAHLVVRRDGFELDLPLSIEPGSTTALLGPNGAGKSTAAAVLAGLVALDDGHVRLGDRLLDDGHQVFVPAEARNIGVVFQDHLLFPHLRVVDNVAFGLTSRGVARPEARRRAEAWLTSLGLAGFGRRHPGELSGGQAQRVALARALAPDPDLLILDEPLSALDVSTRVETRRVLADHLAGFAGPRLLITHDPTDAYVLADRVCVLESGRLVQAGTPDDLRRRPATPYIADLAGVNLLRGSMHDGRIELVGGGILHAADHRSDGPVLVAIRPNAVALHRNRPEGSPRNVWATTVTALDPLGEVTRVQVDRPVSLTVEVTPEAAADLGLAPGSAVWASVKATEIGVESA